MHEHDDPMHTHEHEHSHPHEHVHADGAADGAPSQTAALLHYMLEHNRSHAEEVKALIPKLVNQGMVDAAMMIESGVSCFKDGNDWLAAALRKIEDNRA